MSRTLFDFLLDSFLLDAAHVESDFESISESELEHELERYGEYVRTHEMEIGHEVQPPHRALSITFDTSIAHQPRISLLKQCALYYDRAIVDDPLYRESRIPSDFSRTASEAAGYPPPTLDRRRVAKAASYVMRLGPMVGADYVKLAPLSAIHEPPSPPPVTFSPILFSDVLPESLMRWLIARARVSPLRRLKDGGWGYRTGDKLRPCRGICIEFEDYDHPWIYHLFESRLIDADDESRIIRYAHTLPDTPPDRSQFVAWVAQSINQASAATVRRVSDSLVQAGRRGASLLTTSGFVSDLLRVQLGARSGSEEQVGELALRLSLPVLDALSVEQLMRIRQCEGEAFAAFRVSLERDLRELRHIDDEDQQRRRLKDVEHELAIQVRDVERTVKRLRKRMELDLIAGAASLMALLPSQGLSLATLIMSGVEAFRSYQDRTDVAKNHPGYFLWKLETETQCRACAKVRTPTNAGCCSRR